MKGVDTNREKIEELLTRGVANIYPSKDFVASKILKGEKLTIYLGIDPTGPTLHLGHVIPIKKLAEFQKAGHQTILLMGDFTAMIGDPTDKSATRIQLSHKQVLNNLKNYKKQASSIISFKGKNATKIMFNSKWLGKMKFEDVLNLASKMTVQQMLERDMFSKRTKEGKPVFIHEFLYPLMQGYDSVAMDVDGEIGGNDQTFNMLAGRNLMKSFKNKEKFVITMKLLQDDSGSKMGKTEGNMIALVDSAEEMFGKIMSWEDSMIAPSFELCTEVPVSEIERISLDISSGKINPKDIKLKLAKEIVKVFFGEKKAEEAQENWENTFSKKEIPEEVLEIEGDKEDLIMDLFVDNKIVSSKTDFRRLVDEGAITNMTTEEKIKDYKIKVSFGVYKIGKKRFCKIIVK